MSTITGERKMDKDQIINGLSKMLQKRNNDIINLELQIEALTAENEALKTESKKEKTEKVKTESSEK